LIVDHEHDHYATACRVDLSHVANPSLLALRPKLGTSMATFKVNVARIAITSETTRDAVFLETKTYDLAKLTALRVWVNSIRATVPTAYPSIPTGTLDTLYRASQVLQLQVCRCGPGQQSASRR
jgi:hypothetical protein